MRHSNKIGICLNCCPARGRATRRVERVPAQSCIRLPLGSTEPSCNVVIMNWNRANITVNYILRKLKPIKRCGFFRAAPKMILVSFPIISLLSNSTDFTSHASYPSNNFHMNQNEPCQETRLAYFWISTSRQTHPRQLTAIGAVGYNEL